MVFAFNRRRRRNSWKGHSRLHKRAARKGWRRGHRRRRGRYAGRRIRRRRSRNPVFAYNRRHRRRSRNPVSSIIGGVTSGVGAGFNVGILSKSAALVGGMLATNLATKQAVNYIPIGFLKTSPGNYITELAVAGLLAWLVRKASPGLAAPIFLGGVIDVVKRAADRYISPTLGGVLSGLSDYLSVGDARGARPLSGALGQLDDYLTIADSRNVRPLYGIGDGENAVGDELILAG